MTKLGRKTMEGYIKSFDLAGIYPVRDEQELLTPSSFTTTIEMDFPWTEYGSDVGYTSLFVKQVDRNGNVGSCRLKLELTEQQAEQIAAAIRQATRHRRETYLAQVRERTAFLEGSDDPTVE